MKISPVGAERAGSAVAAQQAGEQSTTLPVRLLHQRGLVDWILRQPSRLWVPPSSRSMSVAAGDHSFLSETGSASELVDGCARVRGGREAATEPGQPLRRNRRENSPPRCLFGSSISAASSTGSSDSPAAYGSRRRADRCPSRLATTASSLRPAAPASWSTVAPGFAAAARLRPSRVSYAATFARRDSKVTIVADRPMAWRWLPRTNRYRSIPAYAVGGMGTPKVRGCRAQRPPERV